MQDDRQATNEPSTSGLARFSLSLPAGGSGKRRVRSTLCHVGDEDCEAMHIDAACYLLETPTRELAYAKFNMGRDSGGQAGRFVARHWPNCLDEPLVFRTGPQGLLKRETSWFVITTTATIFQGNAKSDVFRSKDLASASQVCLLQHYG